MPSKECSIVIIDQYYENSQYCATILLYCIAGKFRSDNLRLVDKTHQFLL